jgi:hypothetical protein
MMFMLTAVSIVSMEPLFSDAYASIGSKEFCASIPGHFACDNENDNDSDDNGTSDEDENFDEPN